MSGVFLDLPVFFEQAIPLLVPDPQAVIVHSLACLLLLWSTCA